MKRKKIAALSLLPLLLLAACAPSQPKPEENLQEPAAIQQNPLTELEPDLSASAVRQLRGSVTNPDFSEDLPREAQEAVLIFLDEWHNSLANLEEGNFRSSFLTESDSGIESYLTHKAVLSLIIDLRK